MNNNDNKIVLITELIEQRLKKQQELEYYQQTKDTLEKKIFFLNKEIQLTDFIIEIIKTENQDLMLEYLKDKHWDDSK